MPISWILNRLLDHILKSFDVFDDEGVASPLDDAKLRKTVDFARDRFAMRTYATRNFGVCWGGINFDQRSLIRSDACEAQQLGTCPVGNVKAAEFVYAVRKFPNLSSQAHQQFEPERRLRLQQ